MTVEIGFKADPILYRYSYRWLFALLDRLDVRNLQFGSFFEMYRLPDRYFQRIRRQAADYGVNIRSCFTSHRELGGMFVDDPDMARVAEETYRRYIEITALLGADSVGSNPGSVLRDHMDFKEEGHRRYLAFMIEMSRFAKETGLRALTVEPMSSLAEPPSTPEEITRYMTTLGEAHAAEPEGTVPVYLCGDVSHGVADPTGRVIHDNVALFAHGIPWMWEFHLKNTDPLFDSTFGFSAEERERGIVDLTEIRRVLDARVDDLPEDTVVAYLELGGPKLGRDYADQLLESQIEESLYAVKELFCRDGDFALLS